MKHVLIMEDETVTALDWQNTFELNGYKVTLTHTGDEAIACLETTQFDLVVTDIFVPRAKGGLHVVGKVLTMGRGAPPVIVVTGSRRHKDDEDGQNYFLSQVKKLGASNTLEKPFPSSELILMAEDIFKRRE